MRSTGLKAVLSVVLLMALTVMLSSCQKKSSPTQSNNNGPGPTSGAHISGVVKDDTGGVVRDVVLHVVYPMASAIQKAAAPMTPSQVVFFDVDQVLDTACGLGGHAPLPDGVVIKIFWDRNNNGIADSTDPQPPLCADPPECAQGPFQTVNMNEFVINGVGLALGAGLFYADQGMYTVGDVLTPNRYFARIYCGDGNVLYESDLVDIPPGPSDRALTFHCTSCEGAPAAPAWSFSQPYPNPTLDSVTVRFGLLVNSSTLVTLVYPDRRVDTLMHGSLSSGGHTSRFRLTATYPNGVYTVRMNAGTYQNSGLFVKNIQDSEVLRGTAGIAYSGPDGTFTFDTPAGTLLDRRDSAGRSAGSARLNTVKVVATKLGYVVADTTFDVADGQDYSLNLRLHAQ
jgi:hypothetical protein